MAIVRAVLLVVFVVVQCQAYPRFELNGYTNLANNSYIDRARIGEGDDALKCVTDNADCCTDPDAGNWTSARGESVDQEVTANTSLYVTRENRAVSLNRYNMTGGSSGMWRCDIPDSSGVMQSIYIYTGISITGKLTSASISLIAIHTNVSPPEFTLTCRSEGGPATTVSWRRNGATVEEDSDHETSQIIVDTTANTVYENRLRVKGSEGGRYRCIVSNNIQDYFSYIVPSIRSDFFIVRVAGKPTDLALTWRTNTSVDISWNSPGSPATGYVIYYQPEGGIINSINIHGRNKESHLMEGIQSGVTYSISIMAVSDHLPSAVVGPLILIPTPHLTAYRVGDEMSNVGNTISLVCEAHLAEGINCDCVNMRWLRDGRKVVTDERVIVTSNSSGAILQTTLSISPLLSTHSGTYRCEVVTKFSLGTSTNIIAFEDVPLRVVVPSLVVETSPSLLDIPNEFPHNFSNLMCAVHAEVKGHHVPLSISLIWVYRKVSPQNRVSFSSIPSTHFTTTGSPEDGYWSFLNATIASDRDKIRCRANLVVERSIQATSDIGFVSVAVEESTSYTAVEESAAIVTPSFFGYSDSSVFVPAAFTTMGDEYVITTTLNLPTIIPTITTRRADQMTTILTPSPVASTVSVLATTSAKIADKHTIMIVPPALIPTASVREPIKPTDSSEDVSVAAAVGAVVALVVILIIIAVVLSLTLFIRMTHATCNMQSNIVRVTFSRLTAKKEGETDMKEMGKVEEEKKIESILDEGMIMVGEEVAAEDAEVEKEGRGKVDKGAIKETSEEDTDEDSFDGNLSNTDGTPPNLQGGSTPSQSTAQHVPEPLPI